MKIINYPAMASPQSIEHISNIVDEYCDSNSTILDPFCGTGRLLVNPRLAGHNVVGVDCSPIALLTARVLHQKVDVKSLEKTLETIIEKAKKISIKTKATRDDLFWFEHRSFLNILKILFTIEKMTMSKNVRRVFWVSMVDAVRKISYLREEEYKLHRMKAEKRSAWKPNAFNIFNEASHNIFNRISLLTHTNNSGNYRFYLGDSAQKKHVNNMPKIDAIITSPPYGDSQSTVGYGQFARIPLKILYHSKIFREEYPIDYNKNVDTVCLGGTNCYPFKSEHIPKSVVKINGGGMKRFMEDYFGRLELFNDALKKDGIICFVLADRVHQGKKVPLIKSTDSFFLSRGYMKILDVNRMLTWKRLPRRMKHLYKDKFSEHSPMNYETVLAYKKS